MVPERLRASSMRIFLPGGAGFIGFHASQALLARGHEIVAIDNLNPYYTPALKDARLAQLAGKPAYRFAKGDIADPNALAAAAAGAKFDVILHLAAQAGVRYALKDPASYTRSNLVGQQNVLEFARGHEGLKHLVYASSSSVCHSRFRYGVDGFPRSYFFCTLTSVSLYLLFSLRHNMKIGTRHSAANGINITATMVKALSIVAPRAWPFANGSPISPTSPIDKTISKTITVFLSRFPYLLLMESLCCKPLSRARILPYCSPIFN